MSWSWLVLRASLFVFVLVFVAACATTPPANDPLPPERRAFPTGPGAASDYRIAALAGGDPSPELFLSLSFSGGGKRSAAFSYGVLKGLREMTMPNSGHRTLDAVDFISGVSGGAFTAAAYGLQREGLFETYTEKFLYDDTEAYIWGTYLLPWKWGWLFSGSFGTNDAMAEVYDEQLFHGATYRDLQAKGRPLIAVNATDVTYGSPFPFIQDQFDLICSDLNTYPLARAVAASNGLPVLFTPITLKNHAALCAGQQPSWVRIWMGEPEVTREHEAARIAERYLDHRQTEYVHLLDGGISDNLAMRPVIGSIMRFNDDARRYAHTWAIRTRRVLLVSVDGQAAADTSWARQPTVSGIGQIIAAVTGSQIDEYNFETLLLAKEQMARLVEELRGLRCRHADQIDGEDCNDVSGEVIHLSLARIKDDTIRKRLEAIPTGLTLSKEDVDLLVQSGRQVVMQSPELKAFMQKEAPQPKPSGKPQS